MRHFDKYEFVIATKEKVNGNESVGSMWTETKTFEKHTPISTIIEWAKNCDGRLIITIDENGASNTLDF